MDTLKTLLEQLRNIKDRYKKACKEGKNLSDNSGITLSPYACFILLCHVEDQENDIKHLSSEIANLNHQLYKRYSLRYFKKHIKLFYQFTTSILIWTSLIWMWRNGFCFFIAN